MGALFNNRVQDVMAERAGAMGGKVDGAVRAAGRPRAWPSCRTWCGTPTSTRCRPARTRRSCSGAVIAIVALIAAVFVKEVPLRGAGPAKEAPSSPEAAGPADAQPVDMAKAGTATADAAANGTATADAKPVEGVAAGDAAADGRTVSETV